VPSDPTSTAFSRWDITRQPAPASDGTGDFRNAHNTFGYIVEIDLYASRHPPGQAHRFESPRQRSAWPSLATLAVWPSWAAIHAVSTFTSSCRKAVVVADANRADRLSVGAEYTKARSTPPSSTPMARHLGEAGLSNLVARTSERSEPDWLHVRKPGRHLRQHLPGGAGATAWTAPEWTAVENGEIYITMTENPDRGNTAGCLATTCPTPMWTLPTHYWLDSKGVSSQNATH
jgi:hypothetical protein